MIYVTGDTHGNFKWLVEFCKEMPHLTRDDVMIILGDAGFNYFDDVRDMSNKVGMATLPITIFCIHGNHEMRPTSVEGYHEQEWRGGIVYMQDDYPNILFAKDGEVFDLDGKSAVAIGGAYSVDKHYRLAHGYRWFEDEQPSAEIKQAVENKLATMEWQVDTVLSHTCPAKCIPTEVFIDGIDQSTLDNSTEEWLDTIEGRLQYRRWFCGHYHTEKTIGKLQFFYKTILPWE